MEEWLKNRKQRLAIGRKASDCKDVTSVVPQKLKPDLVQVYKILHAFDNVDYKNYFELNKNCTKNERLHGQVQQLQCKFY